jgi:predicted adenylyl cyclase CyaB
MKTESINVEIKARCLDHDRIRNFLKSHQAEFKGIDHQIDTYFKVNNGRLKLREGNIENNLIYYEREDKQGPKQCDFILFKSSPESSLKSVLINSCGVLVVVDKTREIYFIENVKFHIDTVLGLGTFMEIEAIDSDESIARSARPLLVNGSAQLLEEQPERRREKLLEQCNRYLKALNIPEEDLVSVSYSDLLLEKMGEG